MIRIILAHYTVYPNYTCHLIDLDFAFVLLYPIHLMKIVVPSFCGMKTPSQKQKNKNIYTIIRENRRYMLDCYDQSTMWQNIVEKMFYILIDNQYLEDKTFS